MPIKIFNFFYWSNFFTEEKKVRSSFFVCKTNMLFFNILNKNCPLVNQWMFGGNKKCTNRTRSFDEVWYLSWYLIVENEYSIRWMNSEVFRWNRIAVSERRTTAVVRAQWNVHQLVFDSIHPNENNRQQQEQQQQHFQMHNKQKTPLCRLY